MFHVKNGAKKVNLLSPFYASFLAVFSQVTREAEEGTALNISQRTM